MTGIVVLIFDFAHHSDLVAVKVDWCRLSQSGHVGISGVIIVGRLKYVVAFEIFDAEVNHNESHYNGEADCEFF